MDAADQKLEVIRKLLAKAERAATTEEADAYNVKAAEMMARHGVDTAMLASFSAGGVPDAIDSMTLRVSDPYSAEKAQLANGVARALGCRLIQHPGFRRGQIDAVTVMGYRSDLRRVELIFTSLLLQATRSVGQQRPPGWSGESTAAFRRTYLVGFANEVYRRLVDAERGAIQRHDSKSGPAGASAALVVADRHSLVDRAYGEQYGHLKAGRKRQLSGSGYAAGQAAGRRADVGQTRVANTRRALERE